MEGLSEETRIVVFKVPRGLLGGRRVELARQHVGFQRAEGRLVGRHFSETLFSSVGFPVAGAPQG